MKKLKFWKILACIFLAWLFLWLWFSSKEIVFFERKWADYSGDPTVLSINKITGKVMIYLNKSGKWDEYKVELGKTK